MSSKRVLIVAAGGDEIGALATYLEGRGLATQVVATAAEALPAFRKEQHDIVVVDLGLTGLVLPDLVEGALSICPSTRIIVIPRTERPSELHRAAQIGASCYARRPLDKEGLCRQIQKL